MKLCKLIIAFSIVIWIGCAKTTTIDVALETPEYLLQEGVNINIDDVKLIIPDAYKKEKRVIFINAKGEKKYLNIKYYDTPKQISSLNNINYTFDKCKIYLYDVEDPKFVIEINATANFVSSDKVVKGLLCLLMPFQDQKTGSFVDVPFYKSGEPEKGSDTDYQLSKKYNGKEFKSVYVGKVIGATKYSEIAYNSEFGVVAFEGANNEIYVFDSFE